MRPGNIWNTFWFDSVYPYSLAILRFALPLYIIFTQLDYSFLLFEWSLPLPAEFMVPGFAVRYSFLPLPFPTDFLAFLKMGIMIAGVFGAVGFLTRFSLLLFSLGYLYVYGVISGWGWHDHGPSLVGQVLFVLTFAPGVTAFSVDRLWRWLRKNREGGFVQEVGGPKVPRWGIYLILALLMVFYVASGAAKLRHGGARWLNGETLSFYLSGKSHSTQIQQYGGELDLPDNLKWKDGFGLEFYLYGAHPSRISFWIASHKYVASLLATAAVLLELSFIFLFLGPGVRSVLLISASLFHTSVFLMMGISFFPWVVIDLSLVDWGWLMKQLTLRKSVIRKLRIKMA